MNMTDWNDLAQVYDEKFKVLERARLTYANAIAAILESVAREVGIRSRLDKDIRTDAGNPSSSATDEDLAGSMRKTLEYSVTKPDGLVHARVLARFSSPWGGEPGFLQLAVVSGLDSKWTGELSDLARADEWVKQQSAKVEIRESEWIYAHAIKVSDPDFLASASETVYQLLSLAHRILSTFLVECIEYRMQCILLICKKRLESEPGLGPSFYLPFPPADLQTGGDFGKQWYLQINPPGSHGFWIAYEFDKGSLMFGNNLDPRAPKEFQEKLEAALQKKIGAGNYQSYNELPSGIIMNATQLHSSSDKEILETMMEAFNTFVRVVAESESAHQEIT